MTIQEKCEQYWNTSNIGDEEIHAVLGWIEQQANTLTKHIAELEAENCRLRSQVGKIPPNVCWIPASPTRAELKAENERLREALRLEEPAEHD
jgi:hypothetical protein